MRKDHPSLELTLVPAYGRDYKTKEDALKAWNEGKDFRIETALSVWCGSYANKEDSKNFSGKHFKIRYNKLQDFVLINVKTGEVCHDDSEED